MGNTCLDYSSIKFYKLICGNQIINNSNGFDLVDSTTSSVIAVIIFQVC